MNVLQSPNALLKQKVFFKPAFAISAANASFLGCHFLMVCVTWRTNEALWCCSVDRPLGCADESIRLFLQNPLPMTQTCLSVRNSYGFVEEVETIIDAKIYPSGLGPLEVSAMQADGLLHGY